MNCDSTTALDRLEKLLPPFFLLAIGDVLEVHPPPAAEQTQRLAVTMDTPSFFLLFFMLHIPTLCSSITSHYLLEGSFLSVENPSDVLVSANGDFKAGFFRVGENAFSFAIWFTQSSNPTLVWMANRDQPVNGKASRLSLLENGNLLLSDAGLVIIWTTATASASPVQLQLLNSGNLVLRTSDSVLLWQSFDSPTDTLLPQQLLREDTSLISSRSRSNYSSGYYKLYFDNDNVLRLLYKGPKISSVYWPDPWLLPWEAGRTTYNISKTAVINPFGHFRSSDDLEFKAADFGSRGKRRLTLDPDGNIRLYSLDETERTWIVTWQAISEPCKIHGICGPNSLCSYNHVLGRTCSCLQGYKITNPNDWSNGCQPEFQISCNSSEFHFVPLANVEFYGYDKHYIEKSTLRDCEEECLRMCNDCKGFQFKFSSENGVFSCYPKALLLNGHHTPSFNGDVYLKEPKADNFSDNEVMFDCQGEVHDLLSRTYQTSHKIWSLKFLLWFAGVVGGVELTCVFLAWCVLFWARKNPDIAAQGYILSATGFRKFTYAELKKATRGFSEEIGRGAGGVVFKGLLSDQRIAAIKRLNEADQGEAEFFAEINFVGRLNHMNLIEMWGYCVEGRHKLLVYQYMERGSLADNLSSGALDWEKRFEIALGAAKGLAYLHEECLEWILHCDIKPQNILLDANYRPKVADLGLSKLLNRGNPNNTSFSRIRGTRGYMAPEWVYKLPITSKVDVYSYGIVVLEMLTGKRQTNMLTVESGGQTEHGAVVAWVRDKVNKAATSDSWIDELVDPMMAGKYDMAKMEVLIKVALQCVEEDRDARPTMSQVVEILLCREDELA
ncbi:putative receptor protein kinase ZmPK1 [Morella rubra]|uniref:Receptor-like serine/threonine-protein kinase n=1 Tax=Morella rubra TaxID=262757 RepID=A0A6A1W9E4_9ROSI|nr:putative receptor protein kinase ZmPK1 [Morella rubra]